MTVLLDTNALIAAFIARGLCHDLLEHCVHRHRLITSEFILNEFRQTLTNKSRYSVDDVDQAVALLLTKMRVVTPAEIGEVVCRDADDDNVLATAIAGNCDCVITGDKDLLVLKRYREIDIIGPNAFH